MNEIIIRPKTHEDHDFIFSSWLKDFLDHSDFAHNIPRNIYFAFHKKIIEKILSRPSVIVLIAAARSEKDVVLGYLVTERLPKLKLMHYVYVKEGFRNFGICKKLFIEAPFLIDDSVHISHLTRSGLILAKRIGLRYAPYLMEDSWLKEK